MNTDYLIDSILRQTAVLVAEAATAEGERTSLEGAGDRLFLHLARELSERGLTSKVIADMLGLALSSYLQKAARLQEAHAGPNQTLWQVLYAWLHERGEVLRTDVLRRFRHEDETVVRGLLNDMVQSGLVVRDGRGPATVYRCERITGSHRVTSDVRQAARTALVWFAVYRHGPISAEELSTLLRMDEGPVERVLTALVGEGRVTTVDARDGAILYQADTLILSREEPGDVEAALLDHLEAVVETVRGRMAAVAGSEGGPPEENSGGTFRFSLPPGHPRAKEIRGLLERTRAEMRDLWLETVSEEEQERGEGGVTVVFYFGQHVAEDGTDDRKG